MQRRIIPVEERGNWIHRRVEKITREIRELDNPALNQSERFDVSQLSKGIYHLVIYNENFKDDRKIVIQ